MKDHLPFNETLIAEFEKVLNGPAPTGRQKEQYVQDFMEEHSELIPAHGLLHHNLNFNCVLSKFPLGVPKIPDWVMLSKQSSLWRCTVTELKQPSALFFDGGATSTTASRAFNEALDQIRGNKAYIEKNRDEIRKRLDPLIQPLGMKLNPIEFEHRLIFGRSAEKNISPERMDSCRIRAEEMGIMLMTYDTVIDAYTNNLRVKKNILRPHREGFAFKRLENPSRIFSFVGPGRLYLNPEQEKELIDKGYDIERWKEGDLLDGDIAGMNVR